MHVVHPQAISTKVIFDAFVSPLFKKSGGAQMYASMRTCDLLYGEMVEEQLELLEPILSAITERLGFAYEEPNLSTEGERLLIQDPWAFVHQFDTNLVKSMKDFMTLSRVSV